MNHTEANTGMAAPDDMRTGARLAADIVSAPVVRLTTGMTCADAAELLAEAGPDGGNTACVVDDEWKHHC